MTGKKAFYTPEEAAAILGVTRRTIYVWLKHKELEASKIGGRWYVTDKVLENKLNSSTSDNP